MKTIASIFAALALTLSGCAWLSHEGPPADGAVRYGSSGELMALDSKLKKGSSREDLLKSVAKAVQSQLSGGVEANAIFVSSISPAYYPLPHHRPLFTAIDTDSADGPARQSPFFVDGKALTCARPAMLSHGVNTDSATTDERAQIFTCVMPFDGGFRTVMYASYERLSLPDALRKPGRFDSASFTTTTFGTIRAAVEAHSARTTIVPAADLELH